MGLLDDVMGAAKGAMLEGTEGGAQGILNNVLQGSSLGGLSGLVDQINGSGLSHLVSSWTGDGQGQPISVDQLKSALTPEHVLAEASWPAIADVFGALMRPLCKAGPFSL